MSVSKRDFEKAQETISELLKKLALSMNQLSSMTREDINYLRRRLDLLEYLLAERKGTQIDPPRRIAPLKCSVCGLHPLPFTVYHHQGVWYCAEHLPSGITWPVGMHGDDLKTYKERK